ncbi:hypothetical protein H257_15594 [Aphanomyces astaci]|uniref:Uncharacterized protein n=1 Tax=Aphanomyces astaci TaxID=112090 RepID=W4FNC2_APHAT|nr:hypothetical protein H257_15594 [Aphanomyces astaci]ETV68431.1 hypothetical protein H257_15594 [Aphanomyces astaci]|eukprot:XP_009842057.1 hypothetical protein H257_15594 [Aphanomyces astaci]
MKFLVALVHAIAASQLLFDNPAPIIQEGRYSYPFNSANHLGLRFRAPSLGDYGNHPGFAVISTLTLDYFKFSVETPKNIPTNASIWLRPELCPSVNDLPACNEPIASSRIPINGNVDKVNFQWTPKSPIILTPNTMYWFVLGSSSETKDIALGWFRGDNSFSPQNDHKVDVRFVRYEGNTVKPVIGTIAPSLQVYAKSTLVLQCHC